LSYFETLLNKIETKTVDFNKDKQLIMENKVECYCEWCEFQRDIFMLKLMENICEYAVYINIFIVTFFVNCLFEVMMLLFEKINDKIQKEIEKMEMDNIVAREYEFYILSLIFTTVLIILFIIISILLVHIICEAIIFNQ
jgi:hypothetical protein